MGVGGTRHGRHHLHPHVWCLLWPCRQYGHGQARQHGCRQRRSFGSERCLFPDWHDLPVDLLAFIQRCHSHGSCSCTFIFSRMFNKGKINTVDIQNATLAGGVAIGASCNMQIRPVWAMICGTGAAFVSCFGFNVVQAKVEDKIGLHDSCGVHNLHGMPALFGTCVVAIATLWNNESYPHHSMQSVYQLLGALFTLIVAIPSGVFTGFVMKKMLPSKGSSFVDRAFWTVADHGNVD